MPIITQKNVSRADILSLVQKLLPHLLEYVKFCDGKTVAGYETEGDKTVEENHQKNISFTSYDSSLETPVRIMVENQSISPTQYQSIMTIIEI